MTAETISRETVRVRRAPLSTRVVAAFLIPLYALIFVVPAPVWAGDGAIAVITVRENQDTSTLGPLRELLLRIRQDPSLLVRDEKQVDDILKAWMRDAADAAAAGKTISLAYRGRVERAIARAWEQYFRFDFKGMQGSLDKADSLLDSLSDSSLQAGYLFELRLLEGMAKRVVQEDLSWRLFVPAARVKPDAVLPEEKYSPDVVAAFRKAAGRVREGPRSTLTLNSSPSGASVLVDGINLGTTPVSGAELTPGDHFIEVAADGYAAAAKRMIFRSWENSSLMLAMEPVGPAGKPGLFFSKRLKEGASGHLEKLIRKLEVGHLLFLELDGSTIKAWLVGSDGKVADSRVEVIPEQGRREYGEVLSLIEPLKVKRDPTEAADDLYLNMPPLREMAQQVEEDSKHTVWYAVLGGVILISLAAGAGRGSSGSAVEVSW